MMSRTCQTATPPSDWSTQTACAACNVKKGSKTPKHAGMKLIKKPVKPRHNPLVHVHLGHHRYKSWKQFLDHAYWSVELK